MAGDETLGNETNKETAKLVQYADTQGDGYFAISIEPSTPLTTAKSRDVVVMVDTSASQVGAYRDDSIEAAKTLIAGLRPTDRVFLAAIDLKQVALTKGFVVAELKALPLL